MRFATHNGDTITLGSSVRDECAYIWVRDTGEGLHRKTIFERFVRATNCDYQFEGAGGFRLCRRSLKLTAVGSSFSAAWVMDLLSQS